MTGPRLNHRQGRRIARPLDQLQHMKACAAAQGTDQCAVLQVTNGVNEQARQALSRPESQVAAASTVRRI